MKILVAYDESAPSVAALEDLTRAGLPDDVEATVVSIVESNGEEVIDTPDLGSASSSALLPLAEETLTDLDRALAVATEGGDRLRTLFPRWTVHAEGYSSRFISEGILEEIDRMKPDLVVIGSHQRSTMGRLIHGSVAQRVLARAHCSLRIGHTDHPSAEGGLRVLVGVDGTEESKEAVGEVCRRRWPAGSVIRVIAVTDVGSVGFSPDEGSSTLLAELTEQDHKRMQEVASEAATIMRHHRLNVAEEVVHGGPAGALIDIADEWGADVIFLGAQGHEFTERILLGSVSSSIVARAKRAVEVVRKL